MRRSAWLSGIYSRTRSHGWVLAGLTCTLLWVAARAEAVSLVPLAQERSVQAESFGFVPDVWGCGAPEQPPCNESVSASDSAPDLGPFDTTVTTPPCTFVSCPPGSARQSSSIELTAITAQGGASGQSSHSFCCGGGSSGGRSVLEVSFRLDEPAAYQAYGIVSFASSGPFTDQAHAYAFWMLIGPGDTIAGCYSGFFSSISAPFPFDNPCGGPIESSGDLEPGDYTLLLQAAASAASNLSNSHQASADYELSFRLIPEPGTALLLVHGALVLAIGRLRARGHERRAGS